MNKEKLNEIETLLDGLQYNLEDAQNFLNRVETQIKYLRGLLKDNEEEKF